MAEIRAGSMTHSGEVVGDNHADVTTAQWSQAPSVEVTNVDVNSLKVGVVTLPGTINQSYKPIKKEMPR